MSFGSRRFEFHILILPSGSKNTCLVFQAETEQTGRAGITQTETRSLLSVFPFISYSLLSSRHAPSPPCPLFLAPDTKYEILI